MAQEQCPADSDVSPYITFSGRQLSNHSFIDVQELEGGTIPLQCHTDIPTCCVSNVGDHRGQWTLPNGSVVTTDNTPTYVVNPEPGRIDLTVHVEPPVTVLEGLYRCDIILGNASVGRVHVGIYNNDKGIDLSVCVCI